MRIHIIAENKLLHVFIEDEECFMYTLEIIEDLEKKEIYIKANGELINTLYEEDFTKLTLSDFRYNQCLYSLYKKMLRLLSTRF